MKKALRLLKILFMTIVVTACNSNVNDQEKNEENLDNRKVKLTNSEVNGIYKGSKSMENIEFTRAVKIEVKTDGTYTSRTFLNSEENKDEILTGTYETVVVEQENKNDYGESLSATYIHGIVFNNPQDPGLNSFYKITSDHSLVPTRSFIETDIVLNRE